MSNEELAQQIQAGRKELMPELWDAVKGFVAQQAYKAACLEDSINEKTGLDTYNDFFNTGYIAVYEAANKFNPERGVQFLTCLGYYLKKHFGILRAQLSGWSHGTYAKAQKETTVDSLNRQIQGDGSDDAIELGDTIADPEDQYEELANKSFIESLHNRLASLLARLPPEQSRAIQLRYYSCLSHKNIAALTDTPPEKVPQIIKDGMNRLRKFAAAGELDNYIERHTNYYTRVSVDAFQSSGTSAVELICIHREEMRRGIVEKLNHRKVDTDDANHTDKLHN